MDYYLQFLREEGAGLYKGYKYPNSIEVQKQKLAELDGEASKLVNLTEQTAKEPVSVRGKAYEGSTVIINGIKYMLTAEVRRVIFKLRNKQVVMVAL